MATYLELETYITDAGFTSNSYLEECHMRRTVFRESGKHIGWQHEGRKLYGDKTILEGVI